MALYGIRENKDLDVVVPVETFVSLRFNKNLDFRFGRRGVYKYRTKDSKIEIFGQMPVGCQAACVLTKPILKQAVICGPYSFASLDQVLAYKKMRRTDYDLKDIKLIEEYLET